MFVCLNTLKRETGAILCEIELCAANATLRGGELRFFASRMGVTPPDSAVLSFPPAPITTGAAVAPDRPIFSTIYHGAGFRRFRIVALSCIFTYRIRIFALARVSPNYSHKRYFANS